MHSIHAARRTDLLLSTMRGFVEALGGKLELRVIFPDGEFVLDELAPPPRARSKKARHKSATDEAAGQLIAS